MNITIRPAASADATALAELAARTFRETFAADNRPEDIALHVAEAYGPLQQGRELADPNITTLLVESEGDLAGYAQLRRGPAPACADGDAPIEVWRFYIAHAWHGRGLAQRLMQRVESDAARLGARTLWLGVWERNERAKAYYRKSGFVDVGSHIFMVGSDPQTDRIMVRQVAPSAPADTSARRFYHGTRANVKPGDLLRPGYSSNYTARRSPWIYFSETLNAAAWGAELARGEGRGRIYQVEPTGAFMDAPNLTDKKFPGNPTTSYRSSEPLRVMEELVEWQGHSPEEIQAMKDGIAGKEPIDD